MVKAPTPALAPDEVLVGVRAIGLNYADIFCCLGLYAAANAVLHERGGGAFCPGLEFAGEVLAVGNETRQYSTGDRVYGFSRFGAYRTAVACREPYVRKIPDDWSFSEAAALLVQGLTAWHGLVELGAARAGSRVLVHSAAGGVGCAALEICQHLGCDVVGVIGSEAKQPFLAERFPNVTPLVRGPARGFAAQLAEHEQFDVVLESLGGEYLSASLDHVAPMGRLVTFGATAAYGGARDGVRKWLSLVPNHLRRPKIDPGTLVSTNRAVMGLNLIWCHLGDGVVGRGCGEGLWGGVVGRGVGRGCGEGLWGGAVGRSFARGL